MKQLLLLSILLFYTNASAQSNISVGAKAPKINITDWIKNEPTDKNLSNKYIILEFWATWCGPCIAAVPHMNELQEKFNSENIYYISITDESVEKVRRSLKRVDFKSMVVTDLTKQTQINFGDGQKGLEQYPLTVLIDNNNIVRWIGEPKNLDNNLMATFLGRKESTKKMETGNNEVVETGSEPQDFLSLIKDKSIEYYFSLTQSDKKEPSQQSMGTKILSLQSQTLKNIYTSVFKVNDNHLEIPETYKETRFDLLYKNINAPKSLEDLEEEILKELNLTKQTKPTKVTANIVNITDSTLLEETLEKNFSAKSDADDRIIFTAYTINDMLEEISLRSSEIFDFQTENDKKYDFIIGIDSKKEISKSLESYGLGITQKEINVDYIKLK